MKNKADFFPMNKKMRALIFLGFSLLNSPLFGLSFMENQHRENGTEPEVKKTFKNAARSEKICRELHRKYYPLFMEYKQSIAPTLAKQGYRMLFQDEALCMQQATRNSYVEEIIKVLDHADLKIAFLTSSSDRNSDPASMAIWEGINLGLKETKTSTKKQLIKFVYSPFEGKSEKDLFKFILEQKISSFIVDMNGRNRENVLSFLANLHIPTISLSPKEGPSARNHAAINIFPDEEYLAANLAIISKKKGIKKVAVLRPVNGISDKFIAYFIKAAKSMGLSPVGPIGYSMDNFEDLSIKIRSLIAEPPLNPMISEQAREGKKIASTEAVGLSAPETPAQLLVDAVLVPDSFLHAVHISKIFKYHGVPRTLFMGNHLWRQKLLLESKSPEMYGSFFVDFIGAYSDLPEPLMPNGSARELVLPSEIATRIDFQLLGYKASKLLIEAGALRETRKKTIKDNIDYIVANENKYPSLTLKKSLTRWPSHLFEVNAHGIELLGVR